MYEHKSCINYNLFFVPAEKRVENSVYASEHMIQKMIKLKFKER